MAEIYTRRSQSACYQLQSLRLHIAIRDLRAAPLTHANRMQNVIRSPSPHAIINLCISNIHTSYLFVACRHRGCNNMIFETFALMSYANRRQHWTRNARSIRALKRYNIWLSDETAPQTRLPKLWAHVYRVLRTLIYVAPSTEPPGIVPCANVFGIFKRFLIFDLY